MAMVDIKRGSNVAVRRSATTGDQILRGDEIHGATVEDCFALGQKSETTPSPWWKQFIKSTAGRVASGLLILIILALVAYFFPSLKPYVRR